jgi:hypothetical protein
MDRPEDALPANDRAMRGAMDMPVSDLARAAIPAVLGRRNEARDALAPVLARRPDATVGTVQQLPFQRDEDRNRYYCSASRGGFAGLVSPKTGRPDARRLSSLGTRRVPN